MDHLLTVVIPVYNGEAYVARAVKSVLNQPLGNTIDIIIVDDGSSDSSGAICDKLAEEREREREKTNYRDP